MGRGDTFKNLAAGPGFKVRTAPKAEPPLPVRSHGRTEPPQNYLGTYLNFSPIPRGSLAPACPGMGEGRISPH